MTNEVVWELDNEYLLFDINGIEYSFNKNENLSFKPLRKSFSFSLKKDNDFNGEIILNSSDLTRGDFENILKGIEPEIVTAKKKYLLEILL